MWKDNKPRSFTEAISIINSVDIRENKLNLKIQASLSFVVEYYLNDTYSKTIFNKFRRANIKRMGHLGDLKEDIFYELVLESIEDTLLNLNTKRAGPEQYLTYYNKSCESKFKNYFEA